MPLQPNAPTFEVGKDYRVGAYKRLTFRGTAYDIVGTKYLVFEDRRGNGKPEMLLLERDDVFGGEWPVESLEAPAPSKPPWVRECTLEQIQEIINHGGKYPYGDGFWESAGYEIARFLLDELKKHNPALAESLDSTNKE
jgi:hypothetical protein